MQPVIACTPVSEEARDGIPFTPYRGSIVIHCERCHQEMWIGPEQQKFHALGTSALCMPCLVRMGGGQFRIVQLTNKRAGE